MNNADIRHLRHKFIAIAMLSLSIVLVFLGVALNVISYYFSVTAIRKTLSNITELDAAVETRQFDQQRPFFEIFTPEYRHNHYFVLTYQQQDRIRQFGNTIDEDEWSVVYNYADDALNSRATFARRGNYYYLKTDDAEGNTTIALLDCTDELSFIYRILLLTSGISLLTLAITFLLVYRFSAKAVQPEIENNRRQKEFITSAGHELKTPLAVIRANTELLELTLGSNEWTQSTLSQVDRIDGLIRNLVLIAKAQERAQEDETTNVDVTAAVCQTMENYAALAIQSGHPLRQDIQDAVRMQANEADIRQLTTILIDNAIKYCDEGKDIEVVLTAKKGSVELRVSNAYAQGEQTDYNRFFDRFYRNDSAHNIDRGGYGIGLSIAESICAKYRGHIKAQWKDGVVTFVCQLSQ